MNKVTLVIVFALATLVNGSMPAHAQSFRSGDSWDRARPSDTSQFPWLLDEVDEPSVTSTSDWRSGNRYRTERRLNGDTVVSGSNLRTGSRWRTTIKPDGSMRGTDSNRNLWRYNARTGVYQNFGTGTTCIGRGYAQTCF
jgi:hypothetical protein